jgi:hypothetical protein
LAAKADHAQEVADDIAFASAGAAVVTSESVIGGAFFGGGAIGAKIFAGGATIVGAGAKIAEGNYRGAASTVLSYAVGQFASKALLGVSGANTPSLGGEQADKFNELAADALGSDPASSAVNAAICGRGGE